MLQGKRLILFLCLLLLVKKPISPSFISGKTGTVLNVYTKPEYEHKGYAKSIIKMILEDASGKYHNMRIVLK